MILELCVALLVTPSSVLGFSSSALSSSFRESLKPSMALLMDPHRYGLPTTIPEKKIIHKKLIDSFTEKTEMLLKGAAAVASMAILLHTPTAHASTTTTPTAPTTAAVVSRQEKQEIIMSQSSSVVTRVEQMHDLTSNAAVDNLGQPSLPSILTLQTPRTGRVMDLSSHHVLSLDDQQLILNAIQHQEHRVGTGIQVVVTDEIDARFATPKEMATALFNQWQINGQPENNNNINKNNGVLILVVLGQRRAEIEVGAGIGKVLLKDWCERTLQRTAVPAFRRQEYGQGISQTIEAIGDRMADSDRAASFSKNEVERNSVDATSQPSHHLSSSQSKIANPGLLVGLGIGIVASFSALAQENYVKRNQQRLEEKIDSIVETRRIQVEQEVRKQQQELKDEQEQKKRKKALEDKIARKTNSPKLYGTTSVRSPSRNKTARRSSTSSSNATPSQTRRRRDDWDSYGGSSSSSSSSSSNSSSSSSSSSGGGGSSSWSSGDSGGGYSDGDGGGADW